MASFYLRWGKDSMCFMKHEFLKWDHTTGSLFSYFLVLFGSYGTINNDNGNANAKVALMLTLTLTLTAYLRERLTMHNRRNALHIKLFSFRSILSVNLTTRFLVIGILYIHTACRLSNCTVTTLDILHCYLHLVLHLMHVYYDIILIDTRLFFAEKARRKKIQKRTPTFVLS